MRSVLIVEDDLVIADLLQEVLEREGFVVTDIARTVDEARRSIDQAMPEFAVIDLHLADGGDGAAFGTHLRKLSKAGVIFSTGNDQSDLTTASGDAVMVKPYRLNDVALGLQIISEIADQKQTDLALPRNFRLLSPAADAGVAG